MIQGQLESVTLEEFDKQLLAHQPDYVADPHDISNILEVMQSVKSSPFYDVLTANGNNSKAILSDALKMSIGGIIHNLNELASSYDGNRSGFIWSRLAGDESNYLHYNVNQSRNGSQYSHLTAIIGDDRAIPHWIQAECDGYIFIGVNVDTRGTVEYGTRCVAGNPNLFSRKGKKFKFSNICRIENAVNLMGLTTKILRYDKKHDMETVKHLSALLTMMDVGLREEIVKPRITPEPILSPAAYH